MIIYSFFYNLATDFKIFLSSIVENLIKPGEKKSIKNINDFLLKINHVSKNLKHHINKKYLKNNDLTENNPELNDKIYNDFIKTYKSLNLGSNNDEDDLENMKNNKLVKEIFSHYLYLKENHKFQNQRVISNANNLFESLFKLIKKSYDYSENEYIKYFNYFIDNFNNLFILVDLQLYSKDFARQIKQN